MLAPLSRGKKMEQKPESIGPKIGGTVIAFFVAVIVILAVSSIVAILMSLFQYYVADMREEAALIIGNIAGGIMSVYAARSACDSTIKQYSSKSLFVMISVILTGIAIFELTLQLNFDTFHAFSFLIPTTITSYIIFWNEDF
jgi:Na+/phosphate symporter